MNRIISFFRDVLDGPLYVILVIVCLFLIFMCIFYLLQVNKNKGVTLEQNGNDNESSKINYSVKSDYTSVIISEENKNKSPYSGDSYK